MRLKGTKYKEVNELPDGALPVSVFAANRNMAVGYIYVKYERSLVGKASVDYDIVCFKGINW